MEKTYYITDQLQNQINWGVIMKLERYAGGHDEQMKQLFTNSKVIAHWNEGEYQGQVATCVKLLDGRYAIYNDYYGSCSGCDLWENASDHEVRNMCITLAKGAYVFEDFENLIKFLENVDEESNYNWSGTGQNLLKEIKKLNKGA